MVAPKGPDSESLRLELQEATATYRHLFSQLTQVAGFLATADVVLLSYGFAQRLAAIILLASLAPIYVWLIYFLIGSFLARLTSLTLRLERELLIRRDSIGATYMRSYFRSSSPPLGGPIEDLNDEEVRNLRPKWDSLWAPVPIILYLINALQVVLFVLSLTVFHYRFM